MNKINEKLLTNLKIIAKIKVNEKIYVNNNQFVIVEKNNILLSLFRAFYREDRNKNIIQINEIYDDIFIYVNNQLHSKYLQNNKNLSELEHETHLELCYMLKRISDELFLSKTGINNLKQTYNHDTLIDSELDNIINRIDNTISKIKEKVILDVEIKENNIFDI